MLSGNSHSILSFLPPLNNEEILLLGVDDVIGHHLAKRIIAATDWEVSGIDMQTNRVEDLLSRATRRTLGRFSK